ncbi:hypothetical protein N748_14335 [Legionella pneumophila str. 121004]|nr:hypothetical protein N748_14335 [Legionella pneumophila str. 121004]ERH45011.1 hypothetical protein N751_11985 [Legionella pneumophila str. Leg01/11]ERI49079.1 hypothetical protein N749_07180 [Legionella pneumophila str. Leg01/20]
MLNKTFFLIPANAELLFYMIAVHLAKNPGQEHEESMLE